MFATTFQSKTTAGYTVKLYQYDSMGEYVAACQARRDAYGASSDTGRADFYGTDSFEDACDLAVNGWSGITHDLSNLLDQIEIDVTQLETDTVPVWDVTGASVDIEAYLNGEPECMIDFDQSTDRPIVKLLVHTAFRADVDDQTLLVRGAAICGLAELLMAKGYAVEVWTETCSPAIRTNEILSILVKVKDANEYVDIERIAFAIGHPSWARRLSFGWREGMNATDRMNWGIPGSYGKPHRLQCGEWIGADVSVEKADDVVGKIRNPVDWVKSTLDQITG